MVCTAAGFHFSQTRGFTSITGSNVDIDLATYSIMPCVKLRVRINAQVTKCVFISVGFWFNIDENLLHLW